MLRPIQQHVITSPNALRCPVCRTLVSPRELDSHCNNQDDYEYHRTHPQHAEHNEYHSKGQFPLTCYWCAL
jgi:hypothetical protein